MSVIYIYQGTNCKCDDGDLANGGRSTNALGNCEFFCSRPFNGTRYCGVGNNYQSGDYIDCRDPGNMFVQNYIQFV